MKLHTHTNPATHGRLLIFTFLPFPFKNLRVAWLTHSFHCCAFKFPQRHDPYRHAQRIKYLADLHKKCINEKLQTDTISNTENNGIVDGEIHAVSSGIPIVLFLTSSSTSATTSFPCRRTPEGVCDPKILQKNCIRTEIKVLNNESPFGHVQEELDPNRTLLDSSITPNVRNKRFIDNNSDEIFFK